MKFCQALLFALTALLASGAVGQLAGCGSVYGEALSAGRVDDASSDGALTDARARADAEARPPFCSSHPVVRFCADFDEGTYAGFEAVVGDVTLDNKESESPPTSARVHAEGTSSYLETSLFGNALAVSQQISFDINVDFAPTTNLIFWQITEPSAGCTFQLGARGRAAALYATTSSSDDDAGPIDLTSPLAAAPVAGEWSHVSVLLTSDGRAVSIVVKIGNITALDQQTRCTQLSTRPTVRFGISTGLGASGTAHYDNILIEEN